MDFQTLKLAKPIQTAILNLGYTIPTPIQAQAIPPLQEGRDLLGIAQTGTGKTAAFALPILDRLHRDRRRARPKGTRVLILTPTRELASQIDASFRDYGKGLTLSRGVIFGGVGQNPQVRTMSRGVDILTATPGRLLDLMSQGHVRLDSVEVFVLDEADRMLDMGFIHDIRRVIATLPAKRQTLLFSATMPPEIAELAAGLLSDPIRVEVTPQATTVERIDQKVLYVAKADKRRLLQNLLEQHPIPRALVFTRTKHGADQVTKHLEKNAISATCIHGNKSQGARERALVSFRNHEVRVLVATDIAARGIDFPAVSHVINFDLPHEPESYVHRIGRTARAGAEGAAISFCDPEERSLLRDIERCIRQSVPVDAAHPFHTDAGPASPATKTPAGRGSRPGRGGGRVAGPTRTREEVGRGRGDRPQASRGNQAAASPPAREGTPGNTRDKVRTGVPSSDREGNSAGPRGHRPTRAATSRSSMGSASTGNRPAANTRNIEGKSRRQK
ncbi:MAG: DEAD/DEAH box helicase [Magnetococcales bacterium]|nr:DEAD/DEAH box helicase [Magnetococcales bacterium]MBF0157337.1 DEAD/DEAH box helicase [Magnetococcales bacterium]